MTQPLYPKITIITPSYNQAQFIEETILSIVKQDYPNLEYIVIDGGSTDETVNIIKKYESRISYWVSEKDNGQSDAINKGIRRSSGDIINWINSDDRLLPGALQKIAGYFNEYPDACIIHGRIRYFGDTTPYYSRNLPEPDLSTRYAAHISMPQPATFFRRKLIEEQGALDEDIHFSMDGDLYARAALHYPIIQVEDVFAEFRLHKASKSVSSFKSTFLDNNKTIFNKVLLTLGDNRETLKQLGLFEDVEHGYRSSAKKFNIDKLVFYFIQHRLYTLYHHNQNKEFKKLFNYLLKKYTKWLLGSPKLLLYRLLLFMPSSILHSMGKFKSRKA